MKKNLLWMMVAILLCGSTTVLTACGSDDDDKGSSPSAANTYEVTLAALLPRCSTPYLQLKVNYTDADGKSESILVKEGDQSQALSNEAKILYEKATMFIRANEETNKLIDDVIVRNITFKVPAGKTFTYNSSIVTRTDYTVPTEKANLVQPCVICSAKRISGTGRDDSASALNGSLNVTGSFGVHPDKFAELLARMNGRDAGSAQVTLE